MANNINEAVSTDTLMSDQEITGVYFDYLNALPDDQRLLEEQVLRSFMDALTTRGDKERQAKLTAFYRKRWQELNSVKH